ncbi:unnamed protein product [Onchocerca flexuosa]|uniref:Uncharacterized protein n=1 Tax=Onchocerca flexuosa TaxID=387005 RepID=A0A183HGZ6_9BILA|nr:unnamed protein product [Onchocerca flexuosa]
MYQTLVRCLRSSSLLLTYDTALKDQLLNGVIEEVPSEDERGVVPYLPHHEVSIPSKNQHINEDLKASMKFYIEGQ